MGNIHEESGRVPGRGAYTSCQARIEEIAREDLLAKTRSSTVGCVGASEVIASRTSRFFRFASRFALLFFLVLALLRFFSALFLLLVIGRSCQNYLRS